MERSTRIAAAVFLLAGGLVHLQLWRSGYRGIPYIGPMFAANAALSALLALVIAVWTARGVAIAGIAFAASSLGALVLSRTVGFLGFNETAWTDEAIKAATAEVGAIVALVVLSAAVRRRPEPKLAAVAATPSSSRLHPGAQGRGDRR